MNVYKTGEEVLKIALRLSRCRHLLSGAHLGPLLQRGPSHLHLPPASSSLVTVTGHASTVRYYSQGDRFVAPAGESVDVQTSSESQGPRRTKKLYAKNVFFEKLDECSSPSDVLDLLGSKPVTQRRISNSLQRIWNSIKKLSDDQRRYELKLMFEHPRFEELCHDLIAMAPEMQPEAMAFSLLALVRLDVPQRSRVVQTLLRVIQVHYTTLSTCLWYCTGTPVRSHTNNAVIYY